MVKKPPKHFIVNIDPQEPLYVIGVVSEMLDMPVWTLRKLDDLGVVSPERKGKRTRCYSQIQIQKLSYVNYLMTERQVNISGVKVILEMETGESR
jgi:MerR family transcriptional regulator/heat shock protein HspR